VNGKIDTEISNRVQKTNQIYYQINQTLVGRKEINNTKMGIYNMVYLSALFCGSEIWMTLTKYESRITGAEIWCIRKCMDKTSRERIRNNHIRGILNQETVTKMVDKRELRWFRDLIRMDSSKKPWQVWDTRVEGMWGRGRPSIEWEELVQKLTKILKMLQEVTGMVKDRETLRILLM
jgi:hypothetical protein